MAGESAIEVRVTGPADARIADLTFRVEIGADHATRLLNFIVETHGGTPQEAVEAMATKVLQDLTRDELRHRRVVAARQARAAQEAGADSAAAVAPITFSAAGRQRP